MKPECDCPATCNVTTYNADLSFAALSLDSIDSILLDKHAAIKDKNVHSKALRHRVIPSSMTDILAKLRLVDKTVAQFSNFWTSKIDINGSSLISHIESALDLSIDMANNDVKSLFKNITNYIAFYNRNLAMERIWLEETLVKVDHLIKDGLLPILHKWDDIIDPEQISKQLEQLDQAEQMINSSISFLEYYGTLTRFKNISISSTDKYYFPSKAVRGDDNLYDCKKSYLTVNFSYYKQMADKMLCAYNQSCLDLNGYRFYNNLTSHSNEEFYNEMTAHYAGWKILQNNFSICLTEYSTYLSKTNLWLEENQMLKSAR